MARITPNENASQNAQEQRKDRVESITAGTKIASMVGFFFETHNGNKKLQIGYAIIEDKTPIIVDGEEKTEVGLIHIDSLLIRDSVMWKHQKWSGGCGFSEAYDNEDPDDIMKIVLSCPYVEIDIVERSYEWNGQTRSSMEIQSWSKLSSFNASSFHEKVIQSCEQSFEKIIEYRVRRGDNIQRATQKVQNDENADFDNYVNDNDTIPF